MGRLGSFQEGYKVHCYCLKILDLLSTTLLCAMYVCASSSVNGGALMLKLSICFSSIILLLLAKFSSNLLRHGSSTKRSEVENSHPNFHPHLLNSHSSLAKLSIA